MDTYKARALKALLISIGIFAFALIVSILIIIYTIKTYL